MPEFMATESREDEVEPMVTMRKSPVLAGILSLMPGLGQIYVGYYMAGFIHVIVAAGCISVLNGNLDESLRPFVGVFLAFFWMFNVIDAVRRAKLYNLHQMKEQAEEMPTDSPLVGGIVLLLAGILFTLHVTFDVDMEFLNDYWPLALLGGGVYLIGRYFHQKGKMRSGGL